MGSDFIPATLATRRDYTDGAFSIDSTLTRIFIDARAPTDDGQLLGYIEWGLNATNNGAVDVKIRHACGTWVNSHGTLLAGHTWSSFMDLELIQEGLTEPAVSGVIFTRQPQIRWSQPLSSSLAVHTAIEDPGSSDVFDGSGNPELNNTMTPDIVLGAEYNHATDWHLRVNSIVSDINVDLPAGGADSELAWGLTLSGHINFLEHDRWVFSSIYGEGLGRYLLGIQSSTGGAIDLVNNELELRDNWGAMTAYQHFWSKTLRSTAMVGYAKSKGLDWLPQDSFESS